MCKFNQNLFLVSLLWCSVWLVKVSHASPVDFLLLDDLTDDLAPSADYDLTYDQRQNGTENILLRIDGVIVAIPTSAANQASAAGSLATDFLLQAAAGAGSDDDDDLDYFPFVKNAQESGVTPPSMAADKDKEMIDLIKEEKSNKKKVPKPDYSKDGNAKRVVVIKETSTDEVPQHHRIASTEAVEESTKLDVVPVKKVQSRRKIKHKLRLAGLIDFLERYRNQY